MHSLPASEDILDSEMQIPWSVDDLEIVGYADVLDEAMVPSVVPPVFRLKSDNQRIFLPPYSLNAGFLCNAAESSPSALEHLRDSGEVTLIDSPFDARRDFCLWIDQSLEHHYEPLGEAERKMSSIADEEIVHAEAALSRGDLQEAERVSGIAISADDRRVEPLAIKAALCRIRGDAAGERLMAKLAAPALKDRFRLLVDAYAAGRKVGPPVPAAAGRRAMHGMACERPKPKAA